MKWFGAFCLSVVLCGCSNVSTEKAKTVGLTGKPKVGDKIYTDGKWWKVSEISANGDRSLGIGPVYHYCKLTVDEQTTQEGK